MITTTDEGKGLVRVCWADIRNRVAKVEPNFAEIVDRLNPGKLYPLYLAYYPYGAVDADTKSSLFPDMNDGYYRVTDANVPKEILTHLGYSKNNTPLGMVLDKQIESYIDLKNEKITIPWLIYTPGKIFPFTRILSKKSDRIYSSNGLLSSTAGARSTFMLPSIGCATHHSNLTRDFNIQALPPKSLYDHWHVFKEIANSKIINADWRCCVLYFSDIWINKIHTDKAWSDLKQYLHEMAWYQFEYEINRVQYDMIFSIIQMKRNLKPNPYLTDTAKHLFVTAIGAAPGYIPALDESAMPLSIIQKTFTDSYGLKKYFPTIMQPSHFTFEKDKLPVYYSLQHPSTHVFSPKSRAVSSTLVEMRELERIMRIFIEELSKNDGMCSDTVIRKVATNLKLSYFHNKIDHHKIIRPSNEIAKYDSRFAYSCDKQKNTEAIFAADAPFVRGCISINVND